jgi:hypothetical protein
LKDSAGLFKNNSATFKPTDRSANRSFGWNNERTNLRSKLEKSSLDPTLGGPTFAAKTGIANYFLEEIKK